MSKFQSAVMRTRGSDSTPASARPTSVSIRCHADKRFRHGCEPDAGEPDGFNPLSCGQEVQTGAERARAGGVLFQSAVMRTRGSDPMEMGDLWRALVSIRCHADKRFRPSSNDSSTGCPGFNPLSCGQEVQTLGRPKPAAARRVSIRCHADKRFRPSGYDFWHWAGFNPLSCGQEVQTASSQLHESLPFFPYSSQNEPTRRSSIRN